MVVWGCRLLVSVSVVLCAWPPKTLSGNTSFQLMCKKHQVETFKVAGDCSGDPMPVRGGSTWPRLHLASHPGLSATSWATKEECHPALGSFPQQSWEHLKGLLAYWSVVLIGTCWTRQCIPVSRHEACQNNEKMLTGHKSERWSMDPYFTLLSDSLPHFIFRSHGLSTDLGTSQPLHAITRSDPGRRLATP